MFTWLETTKSVHFSWTRSITVKLAITGMNHNHSVSFNLDGEHQFLDLEEKLSKLAKYAPHLWKDDVSMIISYSFQ